MTVSKFKVGDKVYAPFRGYGIVTKIHDDNCVYPIEVTWNGRWFENSGSVSTFTANGWLLNDSDNPVCTITVVEKASLKGEKEMEECINFKVGDRVFYSYHGLGTVIANHNDGRLYPIDVKWDKSPEGNEVSTFTKDGFLLASLGDCGDNDKLTVVGKVMPAEEEKKDRVSSKDNDEEVKSKILFKVGDRVWFSSIEKGTIVSFNPGGKTCIVNSDLDGEDIGTPIATLVKIAEDDAINPSHYQVDGIPEAIEIMEHLMTKGQLEGFLWGNIIKYSYRYGRKGNKKETAGKIEWYAQRLKELDSKEKEK